MTSNIKYVGMDVHKESISIAVRNAAGKIVMECVIETKASTILQFVDDAGCPGTKERGHAACFALEPKSRPHEKRNKRFASRPTYT